ncbi:MAG: DMT family transporter, partial [Bryobacteraceae bacterium]
TLLLIPIVICTRQKRARANFGRHFPNFVILGVLGSVVAGVGLAWGQHLSLASNASVIALVLPLLNALMAVVLLGERMNRLLWVSFGFAIVGVLIVSDANWHSVEMFRGKYLAGNALIFFGYCGSAFYNAFGKRLMREFTPPEVLLYAFLAAETALFCLTSIFEPLSWPQLASLGPTVWLSLVTIAVVSQVGAMLLFLWTIKRIELSKAALSNYLLPVFGVLLSTITLKEKVTWQMLAGGLLVFVGTYLATTYEERKKKKVAKAVA